MLMRLGFLLLGAALITGCKSSGNSTAMAASDVANLTFSPEPGVRSGYVRIRPKKIRQDAATLEYEWRLKGAGLPGGAKFYNNRMTGDGPVDLTMQISGAIQFDGRIHLLVRESGTQVSATQRVEISAGSGGKAQEKTWTVPGTLKDSVKIERSKVVELEMPFQTDLAKIGGNPITLDFQQSQF
jgi:hypothetical protein